MKGDRNRVFKREIRSRIVAGKSRVDMDGDSHDRAIETAVKIALLAVVTYASWAIISPFLTIGLWSAILAVALYPIYFRLSVWVGPKVTASFITAVSFAVVLGPLAWLGYGMAHGIGYIADGLESGTPLVPMPPDSVKTWPIAGERLYHLWLLGATNAKAMLVEIAPQLRPLAPRFLEVAQNVMVGLLQFLVAIIIAGFLFAPGPKIVEAISRVLDRLLHPRGREIVRLIGATIRNVSRGVVGVSVLQTALAGLGFLAAGVPGAGVLAFIALVLGIIQIGPGLVILAVIIWSWFELGTMQAMLFTAYMIPVGLVDNVLRPIVMARGLSTPIPVIIIGALGGTISQGIMGLFLGPVIVAVSWQLILVWLQSESGADEQARQTSDDDTGRRT
jgi:predicted PurR-regulated permease PerM